MLDACCAAVVGLAGAAGTAWTAVRRTRRRSATTQAAPAGHGLGRGVALVGTVWTGGDAEPFDGAVVVAGDGTVAAIKKGVGDLDLPADLPTIGGPGAWVGPGAVDAHVHLAVGEGGTANMARAVATGLVAVRDLGAPPAAAAQWRTTRRSARERAALRGGVAGAAGPLTVAAAGPIVTATGGYPSRTWGADGFAVFADSPWRARQTVTDLVADGADLVKVALEPAGGAPVPSPLVVRGLVEAAHAVGLLVTAHALTEAMVLRALDADVDELCHVPTERLTEATVDRIAAAGIPVVSTLQTFHAGGVGPPAAHNAADLVKAGVPLLYGTDLGNDGTQPGVDPRELDRLADTGLGRLGALRAATEGSGRAYGMPTGETLGRIAMHQPAAVVVLPTDPLTEPGAWRAPLAVLGAGHLVRPAAESTVGPDTARGRTR